MHIGDVVKPHGLRGELVVVCHAGTPLLFDRVTEVQLEDARGRRRFAVRAWRLHHERLLLTLQNVPDRTAAEALRGCRILVRADALPPAGEDEVYLHQLEGCLVVLPDGRELGVLEGFLLPSAEQEIWVVRAPDGREILFPAHADTVREVDLAAGRAVVDPPPGLLELYADGADQDRS